MYLTEYTQLLMKFYANLFLSISDYVYKLITDKLYIYIHDSDITIGCNESAISIKYEINHLQGRQRGG